MKQSKGLEKRALKAGIRAAARKGEVLSRDEMLKTKVQIVPAWGRWLLFVSGAVLLGCGLLGLPWSHLGLRLVEVITGVVLMCGGIFGLKKTLANIVDTVSDFGSGADLLDVVIGGIGVAIGSVID